MAQLKNINMIVANPTTPANFFHLLRRQTKLPFRKPLIVMSPKALLRAPECQSGFDEFLPGTSFVRAYREAGAAASAPERVGKLLFCSGKVYYDLVKKRAELGLDDQIAICRIEQVIVSLFLILFDEKSLGLIRRFTPKKLGFWVWVWFSTQTQTKTQKNKYQTQT